MAHINKVLRLCCIGWGMSFAARAATTEDGGDCGDTLYDCNSEEGNTWILPKGAVSESDLSRWEHSWRTETNDVILPRGALKESDPFPLEKYHYGTVDVHTGTSKHVKKLYKIRMENGDVLKPCSLEGGDYRIKVEDYLHADLGGYFSYSQRTKQLKVKSIWQRTIWTVETATIKHGNLAPITIRTTNHHRYVGIMRKRHGTNGDWSYVPVVTRNFVNKQEFVPWCSRKKPSVIYLQVLGAQQWLVSTTTETGGKGQRKLELVVSPEGSKGFHFVSSPDYVGTYVVAKPATWSTRNPDLRRR